MAAVDTSIYNQLLQKPKSVQEYDAEALQGQTNKLALMLNQQKADEYTRSLADTANQRQIVSRFGADKTENYNALLRGGRLTDAQAYAKTNAELGKTGAEAAHLSAQTGEVAAKAVNLASQQHKDALGVINDPQGAADWVRAMYSDPRLKATVDASGSTVEQAIARIPQDPQGLANWKMQSSLGADTLIAQTSPDANARLGAQTSTDNSLRSAASSKYSADSSASTAALGRAQSATQHADSMGKPFEVTGADGQPVLVQQNKGGQLTPVQGYTPKTANLKPIPSTVNAAMIQNSQSTSQIDRALALLGGEDADGMKGDKNATGWKGYLPNGVLNRMDPQGVDARAIVSDIGSLKIHDRSGAAVTLSESPRLMPFIPLSTDDSATVKKKLNKLRVELASESSAMQDVYSKEQGYRPSPVKAAPAPAPAANAKGWVLHTDANGNKAYVSPDGKQFEEAK